MTRRLFWKILIAFWLTFFAIVEGVWVIIAVFYSEPGEGPGFRHAQQAAQWQLRGAAAALHYGGMAGLRETLAGWPAAERARLTVTAADGAAADAGDRLHPALLQRDPGGRAYRLVYDMAGDVRPRPGPLDIPRELVLLGALGGLLFSALLAWYLTRPVRRLRGGFERLAHGDLTARLRPLMGGRRDEIADLAQDFDAMAERLQQLVAAREQLLYDVSHELRSPLTRLQLAIALARQNPQKLPVTLDRIEGEAQRLDTLVGELLTLSRVENNAADSEEYFAVDELLRAVAADAAFEAQSSGAAIETHIDAAAPPDLRGNAELLRRALDNVVRNALRFSAAGQRVRIDAGVDAEDGGYLIRVADRGPGVAPGALREMFEPFVRLDAEGRPGFGLGLAIARRAVQVHGGSIEAENGAAGGLVVTIRLPFPAPPGAR